MKPKILLVDIETSPIEARVWGLHGQYISLNQIVKDSTIIAWSAKWLDSKEIFYEDVRKQKNVRDDKHLLKNIWKLLNEADVVVGHNVEAFDSKRLNERFVINGYKPPASYRYIDTLRIAKYKFRFTSNKLEHLCNALNVKHKKLTKRKFAGMDLWNGCLDGNKEAWREMELYNKRDVIALEEVYERLVPWVGGGVNHNLYSHVLSNVCGCGSSRFHKNGFTYSSLGKYQRYCCSKCGAEVKGKTNLLSKVKRDSLRKA